MRTIHRVCSRPAAAWLAAATLACGAEPAPPDAPAPEAPAAAPHPTEALDAARLAAPDAAGADWPVHGGTYKEQRYSPLDQIHAGNVAELGLAWWLDTRTNRGLEATPIVVDGVLYATGSWSVVFAVDARTGRELWRYDPQVSREYGQRACCDVVNRGVAVYNGRVYAGVLDGRLVALDAATGEVVWEVLTVDQSRPYTITGAPRIAKGRVVIGNGGAEYGVRGYVSAYDAATGELAWRTWTVPGDPSQPFESPALEAAAATWQGGKWWEIGGGGTVWDAIVFDPELDLLYVGTGNGSPWSRYVRSPGGGDNLYLCAILALDPDTGEIQWYYQTTPGDNWDYTSTQPIILAELDLGGRPRKVLMQAPKNGFFYVVDRETGALISAEAFVETDWASGIDKETGRPIEVPGMDYREEQVTLSPGPLGAHNWHPMSYSPDTGLVYIPAQEVPWAFKLDEGFEYRPGAWNLGTDPTIGDSLPREDVGGFLLAWDPVAQKEAWRVPYAGPWNGGVLSTAGNLVFQGTADGRFVAYRADTGEQLFEAPAGTGVIAPPVTYLVDGEQYVSVLAGWGGAFGLVGGDAALAAGANNTGRLLTFKLGGTAELPAPPERPRVPTPLEVAATGETLQRGNELFHTWCAVCHGIGAVGGGVIPDLRFATPDTHDQFAAIVLGGAYLGKGMPPFKKWLDEAEVEAIRAYVLSRAAALRAETGAGAGGTGE